MGRTWDITGIRTVEDVERTVTIATVHELEYHGEWMGDEYVTVSVKSPEPVDFHFGDTLTYRDEAFSINYDPNVVKKAARNKHGEGFTYDNIKLYSDASKMKSIDFKDVVLNPESAANTQVYTSLSAFSFYAASVEDLADRLQANLDREGTGWRVLTSSQERCDERGIDYSDWGNYFTIDGVMGETDVNVEVTNDDHCWQVLKFAYEKFGLSYYCTGKTIVIGGDPVKADHIFRYGRNNGLYEVERTSDENQEIVTKLFAYGSEQNLPLNYYANKDKKTYTSGMVIQYFTADNVTKYAVNTMTSYEEAVPALTDTDKAVIVTNADGTLSCVGTTTKWTAESVDYLRVELLKSTEYVVINGDQVYGNAENFYAALGDNQYHNIYFTYGINKNVWPQSWIETSGDYPAMLSINKLMLPGFPDKSLDQWVLDKIASSTSSEEEEQWETIYDKYTFSTEKHDPWIASSNMPVIGTKEGISNYDGSSQKEIYPTIANTSSASIYAATHITDNGYLTDSGDPIFHLYMYRGEGYLDWDEALKTALDTVYVEMTSGYCTGRKFKVSGASATTSEGTDVWDLTCEREKDPSLERYFPYYESDVSGYCQVQSGDTFVVTGIQMPDSYIEAASEKLFIAACGYLDRRDHMRYTYLPKVDEIYMQRQDDYIKSGASDKPLIYGTKSYHDTLHAGMQMEFEDTDLGIWHTPYIDQLTIKEFGNEEIPTYEVVLRDEKEKGTLEILAEKISDLQNPVIAPTERQTRQSRNAEYPEWIQGQPYYYQTLNPVPFNGVVYIETSYVWHRGKKWMCMRTLTTEEPQLGCNDWKVVEGDQTFQIKFYDAQTNGYAYGESVLVRRGHINIPLWPFVLWGTEDVTSKVTYWSWTRTVAGTTVDFGTTRNITVEDQSMPDSWSATNPATFTCTATISGIETQVTNILTI